MDKSTKCCQLTISLKSGIRIIGTYHVPLGTNSSIRPSDAIRMANDSFLVLSDVTICDSDEPRESEAFLVRLDAISYIELPPAHWVARQVD